MIIFCDLDWTVADCRHRLVRLDGTHWNIGEKFIEEEMDWDVFNDPEQLILDPVYDEANVKLREIVECGGHEIVYATSREDPIIRASVQWLEKHGFPPGDLHGSRHPDGAINHVKDDIFEKYLARIEKEGAVIYDDDWTRRLRPVAERYGVRLLRPDYINKRTGFWEREYERVKSAGWMP